MTMEKRDNGRQESGNTGGEDRTGGAMRALRRHAWWGVGLLFFGLAALLFANRQVVTGEWFGRSAADVHEEGLAAQALEDDLPGFDMGKAAFTVTVGDVLTPYRILFTSVLPGERLPLAVEGLEHPGTRPGTYQLEVSGGAATEGAAGRWTWTAPAAPGLYPLRVMSAVDTVLIQAFVERPWDGRTPTLNGYRLGAYPAEPLGGNPIYNRPSGFIEVTAELVDVPVSPHFTLGQFLSKQPSPFPKYLLLSPRLLLKLEGLLEEINRRGIPASDLHVLSAFRTPFYNFSIGNRTTYSAHHYGIAADVFVDEEGNEHMDDLTGDGRVTVDDARLLFDLVEQMDHEGYYEALEGGLGLYGPAPHRGPFIHVDVRGELVRWGI